MSIQQRTEKGYASVLRNTLKTSKAKVDPQVTEVSTRESPESIKENNKIPNSMSSISSKITRHNDSEKCDL